MHEHAEYQHTPVICWRRKKASADLALRALWHILCLPFALKYATAKLKNSEIYHKGAEMQEDIIKKHTHTHTQAPHDIPFEYLKRFPEQYCTSDHTTALIHVMRYDCHVTI